MKIENIEIGKSVQIDMIQSDHANKQGQQGKITDYKVFDEENIDVIVEFEDGRVGIYEHDTLIEL